MASENQAKLGEVAQIIMGQSPPGYTYNEEGRGTPFFQGVKDFGYRFPTPRVYCTAPTRVAEPCDILLSVRAPIGRINTATERCAIGRGLAIIRPKDPDDARYIEYVLRDLEPYLRSLEGGGSVFGNAKRSDLETIHLLWPDKLHRMHTACILSSLDDKIEINHRMNATLEAMARVIFKSWFMDFDPVRAKMEGREPAGMNAETAALFPDELETVDGQEVPKGWMIGKLGDVAENIRRNIQSMDIGADTNYISLAEMPRKSIALDTWVKAGKIDSNKFQFQAGEFLFGKLRPYFHKVGVAPIDGVCSTDILVIVPKSQILNAFTLAQISSSPFIDFVNQSATGTKMPRTNWDTMARYTIVLPSAEVLGAFERAVGPMLKQIQNNIIQSRTLATIRDTLLPKLISGEIRVPDAMLEAAEA
ncbi:restriction endonuclease subunit S [Methanoculleus sp. 7T]|uniref:restriction endonuclease subunit S n=1 Tax=Methanoculleus sp. 7T TaxID=2937282 RepID=UPI0020BFEAE6|nr:restriction endonuclease subunit S [Methanoculleus sp. 7T]MCK8517704.1 restriction endonuclease subunit S [Methanoculleus sp. 7T]